MHPPGGVCCCLTPTGWQPLTWPRCACLRRSLPSLLASPPLPRPRRLPAYNKLHSILTAVSEELPDSPLYFNLHDMCKTLRSASPKAEVFKSALVNAGYR